MARQSSAAGQSVRAIRAALARRGIARTDVSVHTDPRDLHVVNVVVHTCNVRMSHVERLSRQLGGRMVRVSEVSR
jgi:hypothetical protein